MIVATKSMKANEAGRDGRIDSLKGFLILLVVLGHLIGESDITSSESVVWGGVRTWIYLFHMPLFVLLSGYFTKRKSPVLALMQELKGLILTLIVFQILYLTLLYIVRKEFSMMYLVRPYWILWYVLSLILWRILFQLTPLKIIDKPFMYMGIALTLSLLGGLLLPYGYVFSILRTLNFYPFFLLGYYIRNSVVRIPINIKTKVLSLIVIAIISFVVFSRMLPGNSSQLLLGAYNYPVGQLGVKLLFLLFSLLMSLSFFVLFKDKSLLAEIGRNSLFYYLYHGILIQFIFMPLFDRFVLPWNGFTLICSFLIIMIILWIMAKSKFLSMLIHPLDIINTKSIR